MSFLAPLAPALIGAGGSLLGGLFGSKNAPSVQPSQINYTPPGFSGGGLNSTFANNSYGVTADPSRTGQVSGLASTFGNQATALGGLANQFAPGYSQMRSSQLDALNNQRRVAIGNVKDNLSRRRVLGSSFAQDAVNRTNLDYNQQQQNIIAQSYLQELSASQSIINQQYTAAQNKWQTGLQELNLEAGVAADLTGRAQTTMLEAARSQAQLDQSAALANANLASQSAQGGSAFGGLFGSVLGKGLGSVQWPSSSSGGLY